MNNQKTNLLIKPTQERSKKSLQRLMNASAEQIAAGNFETVSVAEIAKQAEVSVGAFYGRFQNKAALFEVVQQQVFQDAIAHIELEIDAFAESVRHKEPAPTLHDAVVFVLELLTHFYQSNRGMFRAIFLHTRALRDPSLLERVRNFNIACMAAGDRILKAVAGADTDLALQTDWRNGLEIVAVYMRESILFGDPLATTDAHNSTEMKKVAVAMLSNYLSRSKD